MSESSPCLRCGACCSTYRVAFYWAESTAATGGSVPVELTSSVNSVKRCMQGTDSARPRCIALSGEVGKCVGCTIYERRPSVCREVQVGDEFCRRARQHHGLPLLPGRSVHAA